MSHSTSSARATSSRGDRKRASRACDQCHQVRTKCDGGSPCTHCSKLELPCEYLRARKKRGKVPSLIRRHQSTGSSGNKDSGSGTKVTEGRLKPASGGGSEEQRWNLLHEPPTSTACQAVKHGIHDPAFPVHLHKGDQSPIQSVIVSARGTFDEADTIIKATDLRLSRGRRHARGPVRMNYECLGLALPTRLPSSIKLANTDYSLSLQDCIKDRVHRQDISRSTDDNSAGELSSLSEGITAVLVPDLAIDAISHHHKSPFSSWDSKEEIFEDKTRPETADKVRLLCHFLASVAEQFTRAIFSTDDNTHDPQGYCDSRKLDDVPPEITEIVPRCLVSELVEHYLQDSSSTFVREQIAQLSDVDLIYYAGMIPHHRTTSKSALLVSILLVAAQTSESRFLTSPPSARSKICGRLLSLAFDLLTSASREHEGVLATYHSTSGHALGIDYSSDIMSFIHLAIIAIPGENTNIS